MSSNGSRAKWDIAPSKPPKPKSTYIDYDGKMARRRKGGAQRVGFCYICNGSHLWGEPCR